VKHGLVDEYRLLVHPVALGRGLPLFSDLPQAVDLQLLSARRFEGGAIAHIYQPA
jgi:dihydrofolate reductase